MMNEKQIEALKLALEALEHMCMHTRAKVGYRNKLIGEAMDKAREALAHAPEVREQQSGIKQVIELYDSPEQPAPVPKTHKQEPVAWMPIEQMYPQAKAIDILMGDGSILCAVLPQFDGDLWWEGSGTGEKFIDPKYANVTHWRIHGETRPQAREWAGLTESEIIMCSSISVLRFYDAIEAKLKEKNT